MHCSKVLPVFQDSLQQYFEALSIISVGLLTASYLGFLIFKTFIPSQSGLIVFFSCEMEKAYTHSSFCFPDTNKNSVSLFVLCHYRSLSHLHLPSRYFPLLYVLHQSSLIVAYNTRKAALFSIFSCFVHRSHVIKAPYFFLIDA